MTSCRQRLIIQQAIPTIFDIFLVIFIISSIIQCSMIFTRMLSLISVIRSGKKYRKWEKKSWFGGVCPNPPWLCVPTPPHHDHQRKRGLGHMCPNPADDKLPEGFR